MKHTHTYIKISTSESKGEAANDINEIMNMAYCMLADLKENIIDADSINEIEQICQRLKKK